MLTNKQTDKETNASEKVTSLAEVIHRTGRDRRDTDMGQYKEVEVVIQKG